MSPIGMLVLCYPLLEKMMHFFLMIFLIVFQIQLSGEENNLQEKLVSIKINDSRDYAILQEFLRRGFSEEEDYGYVLEGIKPISIRNFQAIDSFLVPNYIDWELFVHEAIPIWNRVCSPQGQNFVFKIAYMPGSKSNAPGFELQFINISRLKEVIKENIALFRYILGPFLTTEQIVNRIAFSGEPLSEILRDNLTLEGIVLGFDLHNSLLGGKIETLSCNILVRDEAPFLPQHHFFQDVARQNFLLPEEIYRFYYLDFAGGDDHSFRDKAEQIQPGLGFLDLEEELKEIQAKEDPLPTALQEENPRFIFAAFQGATSNHALFERLQHAQKWIQSLLKKEDFLEDVLEKIGGKKPTITCAKPTGSFNQLFKYREKEWSDLLLNISKRFENEGQLAFINAFCQPTEIARKRPWAVDVSQATLQGLKKARINLAMANKQFAAFSKKCPPQFDEIVKGLLYVEKTEKGTGAQITAKHDRVRISYVVEDQKGAILFANHDTWLRIRETITGCAHGIQGMHIGETRTLYIHPALAYGALTTLPPCSSLVIKIRLFDIDEHTSCKKPLAPIKPHDLAWVNDPIFYKKIEESLKQIPSYIGSFYRDWLDKRSGLNMKLLTKEIKNKAIVSNKKEKDCLLDER
jgi:FKBP-type peptidyl-prolyl cis-trans isomerase